MAGGSYTSLDDYLRAHYCLLREDMVAPLRSALASLRGPQPTSADGAPREAREGGAGAPAVPAPDASSAAAEFIAPAHVYDGVDLLSVKCGARGVVYRVTFSARGGGVDWACSKRLLFGSLLALSSDGFASILWATVAHRSLDLLRAADGPRRDLSLSERRSSPPLSPSPPPPSLSRRLDVSLSEAQHRSFQLAQSRGARFQMLESPVFFDATRHTLTALQRISAERLPFSQTLLACAPVPVVEPPK